MKSMQLLTYRGEEGALSVRARDYHTQWMTSVAILDEVCHRRDHLVLFVQKQDLLKTTLPRRSLRQMMSPLQASKREMIRSTGDAPAICIVPSQRLTTTASRLLYPTVLEDSRCVSAPNLTPNPTGDVPGGGEQLQSVHLRQEQRRRR